VLPLPILAAPDQHPLAQHSGQQGIHIPVVFKISSLMAMDHRRIREAIAIRDNGRMEKRMAWEPMLTVMVIHIVVVGQMVYDMELV
jgi:hypothetical protein